MKKLHFARKQLVIPYALFMLMFVVLPFLLMVVYAFTDSEWHFTLKNFGEFFTDYSMFAAFVMSLFAAFLTTLFCLLIAYPIAYILAHKNFKRSNVFVMLFIAPMWINFLLRMLAIRDILTAMNIPLGLGTTVVGMIYDFLPFMILPIYNSLQKMDRSLIEAAQDLGANPVNVFFRTTVPLSMPGIVSGIMMVFMPTISAFAISDILSRNNDDYFGTLINRLFNTNGGWNVGSALSIIMLIIIGIAMIISNRFEKGEREGGSLW